MKLIVILRLSNNPSREELNPLIWANYLKKNNSGTVIVMAMDCNKKNYEKCFEYGAEQVILLSDPCFAGADVLATSKVISQAIKLKVPAFDMIIAGAYSMYGETGLVPTSVAYNLGINYRCNVTKFDVIGDVAEVTESFQGYKQKTIEKYPILISISNIIDTYIYEHGLPSLFDIVKIQKNNKEIVVLGKDDIGLDLHVCGTRGSATKVSATHKIELNKKHTVVNEDEIDGVSYLNELLNNFINL